jgi:hypothetical protein
MLNNFTTEELVKELKLRPETEVLFNNLKDTDETYIGDFDRYLDGKGTVLIIRNYIKEN